MSAGTSEFFCLICLLLCSCTAQEKITAELGQDVILPCKVPNNININGITAVGWIRRGLDPEYVFLYRDGRFDPENQHPSYQNRVDLQDKEMKDGEFSLILKDVTMEDTGIYMCRVSQKGKAEVISTYLEVLEPDHSWKIIVGVVVPLVVIILLIPAAGFVAYKRRQIRKRNQEIQEVLQQLEGNNSDIIYQLQQEKQENVTLMNQLMKRLKRSNSDPSIQLQQEKQKNEVLMNHLMKLKRGHSDITSELQREKRRNEFLERRLRKLEPLAEDVHE